MNIAVYCGASSGRSTDYEKVTSDLGKWIVNNKYNLVYGGGNAGLMGIIADSVLKGGCKVTGVMPTFLVDRELAKEDITSMVTVSNMHERKKKMIDLADVFIALPGGPGTLEEITEAISWGRIGQHSNPCILVNYNGFYDCLKQQYQIMVEEGFLTQADLDTVLFADSLEEITPFLTNFIPPKIRSYK